MLNDDADNSAKLSPLACIGVAHACIGLAQALESVPEDAITGHWRSAGLCSQSSRIENRP